jgi:hypothetical protein
VRRNRKEDDARNRKKKQEGGERASPHLKAAGTGGRSRLWTQEHGPEAVARWDPAVAAARGDPVVAASPRREGPAAGARRLRGDRKRGHRRACLSTPSRPPARLPLNALAGNKQNRWIMPMHGVES